VILPPLVVTPDEYGVLRQALLNERTHSVEYIKSCKNRGGELRDQHERRLTMIDELLDRLTQVHQPRAVPPYPKEQP
jgi:hypothetical protein